MASKWMKKKQEMFSKFKEEKKQEAERSAGPRRTDIIWKTPEKGTTDKAKIYQLRLIPDKNDNFYKSFFYHMFKNSKGKWTFAFCPKSYDFENYCPVCAVQNKLYQGSATDKKTAYNYKRKNKHCVNAYIVKDPRDVDAESENEKNTGKVLIYEFPDAVESKIKAEMLDEEYGNGLNIFDPGEDGVDFILKVASTKPIQEEGPNKGKTFPDYSDSKFSNKSSAIGTDDEIESIMESTHDLNEHFKSMERSQDELIQIIKDEMLFELIESDFPNIETSKPKQDDSDNKKEPVKENEETKNDIPDDHVGKDQQESDSSDDISDEDLLKELDDL